jgi:hypothetical protein
MDLRFVTSLAAAALAYVALARMGQAAAVGKTGDG